MEQMSPPGISDGASGEAGAPDIRLSAVRKSYGEVEAVAGIDLEVGRGEFFTMLGPSGSGKTTTLRMIAGFELPDAGTIELGGRDVGGLPAYDREVNTVFQDYALFPHMSVAENVEYGMRVRRVEKTERSRRRDEALEMVRLAGYGERKPAELSGGQRQRVALARAIVNRPRVLLLDEPLGALDLKLREQMQVELKQIQHEVGITFVYVTHDQEEALTMSDRIAVFNEGRIEQVGTPAEVYEQPANAFVAAFVGVSNLLERDGRRFTVRPEKVRMIGNGEAASGLHTEPGRIRDVAYAGMITRYLVELRGRRRASSRSPEPRDVLSRGARGGWPGRGRRLATRTHSRGLVRGLREEYRMSKRGDNHARGAWLIVIGLLTFMVAFAAGCGDDDSSDSGAADESTELTELGDGEGEVNLVAWAGYVEDGSTDPKVDWVTDFEKETGCQVNVKIGNTSDEMVQLMRTGQYDGVSASGDATTRLIEGGDVSPVNTDLIPNYADVYEALKDQPFNTVDGQMYGVPHGRGANLLMYEPGRGEAGAHLVGRRLRRRRAVQRQGHRIRQPDLHRRRGALPARASAGPGDQRSLRARPGAVRRGDRAAQGAEAAHRRVLVGLHEGDQRVRQRRLVGRDDLAGDREPAQRRRQQGRGRPSRGGRDRLVGHLDDQLRGQEPELHVHVDGPHHQSGGERRGRRVVRRGALEREGVRARPRTPNHCDIYHADDEEFFDQIEYWKTPVSDCGDDRGAVCKTYDEWVQGWNEVKG